MEKIYDFAGIGIGPFNLGLAALADAVGSLDAIYFDEKPEFDWHGGMMLGNATLQVAFYADLVTLADPTSRFSFLAYLKDKRRLIQFGILENNYITRREYVDYCRWAASQLENLYFAHRVDAIYYDNELCCYRLSVRQVKTKERKTFYAKKAVIGVGTMPHTPNCARDVDSDLVFHSGEYLYHKRDVLQKRSVTIVGSGQSAAEIFDDLLNYESRFTSGLSWFTRSFRFFPMDYSKLTLEMSTPDYIDYFYRLPEEKKKTVLGRQDMLYKGINYDLINRIYDRLYHLTIAEVDPPVQLLRHCTLKEMKRKAHDQFELTFYQQETGACFTHHTQVVILATGYRYKVPAMISPVRERIRWDEQGRYQVNRDYSVDKNGKELFVQNAELHSHGFNAADLSLGPYRNAVILNAILGYTRYDIPEKNTFQFFGIPSERLSADTV